MLTAEAPRMITVDIGSLICFRLLITHTYTTQILNESAVDMSPSATVFSPTVNASTYTSTTVSTAAAARGSTDNKSINPLTENS